MSTINKLYTTLLNTLAGETPPVAIAALELSKTTVLKQWIEADGSQEDKLTESKDESTDTAVQSNNNS